MTSKGNSKIESAKEIFIDEGVAKISIGLYIIGFLLLVGVYFGPFIYFKLYKKKNLSSQNNTGVKHAI